MKKSLLILIILLSAPLAYALDINANAVQQNTDSGFLNSRTLYEFTMDNQLQWNIFSSDIYLQFFDRSTAPNGGEVPLRNLSFRIPNEGSVHVVFKNPENFIEGIAFCISDNHNICSPAGNGPQVSGVILTD